MANAGDRPPRYGKKTVLELSRGTGPSATGTSRPGGLSYGELHRDREVSPTGNPLRYETPQHFK